MKTKEIILENKNINHIVDEFFYWISKKLKLNIEKNNIKLTSDKNKVNQHRSFGSTSSDGNIWVYVGNRNIADILRTFAHELIHVKQFEMGIATINMNEKHRLKIEDQANALAGRLLRSYGKKHVEIYEL